VVFYHTQSELNESSQTPPQEAEAETHIQRAIERFYLRENSTSNVVIDAYKLEEFYDAYKKQALELAEIKRAVKEARDLLKLQPK